MRKRANMPRWPAWVMFATAAACAYPAVTTPAPAIQESYQARGQEPGWHLRIDEGRLEYSGGQGDVRITQLRREPRTTANGRRYETERLTVDVVYAHCNGPMSGEGYEHRVAVTADGRTLKGCGGERRREWDA